MYFEKLLVPLGFHQYSRILLTTIYLKIPLRRERVNNFNINTNFKGKKKSVQNVTCTLVINKEV